MKSRKEFLRVASVLLRASSLLWRKEPGYRLLPSLDHQKSVESLRSGKIDRAELEGGQLRIARYECMRV